MAETLLLTRSEVASLLTPDECIQAVEGAFRQYAEGTALPPGILGIHARDGGFHIKAGIMNLPRPYFVAKVNANFPQNATRYGLPTIQGAVVVCDAENGQLLALMDSMEITIVRTGAATAVAARFLARRDASVATICGCGNQGRISFRMLMKVRPLKTVYAFDIDRKRAEVFAETLGAESGIEVIAVDNAGDFVRKSDICVTCTTATRPLIQRQHVSPGTFIAAVGADSEGKQELAPDLLAACKVVPDLLEQSASIGELHHALQGGLMTRSQVYGELGEIVAGRKSGRTSEEEIIIFDSTGMALQDVAAAALVFEKALVSGAGAHLNFGS